MAILPVHQMIQQPDIPNAWLRGQAAGMQLREARNALADEQTLRQLTPQALSGDPNAAAQMTAIDPQRATTVQGAGDANLRRLQGFISYVDQARSTGRPEAISAALRAVGPYVSREFMGGKPLPTEWSPDMDAGWDALKARVAGATAGSQIGVQSTYVDAQGNRVAIMRDGSTQILGQNDAGMSQQTINVTGPDGRPAQYTFDKRTGRYVPAQLAGAQAAAPPAGPVQAPPGVYIDPSLPPEVQQQIAAAESSGQQVPSQMFFGGAGGGRPASQFVGMSPAEEAASKRAAEAAVDLAVLPQRQQIETQGAIERARGTAQAGAEVERAAAQQKRMTQSRESIDTLQQVIDILPRASGGMLEAGRDRVAGAFGVSTEGAQAGAQLKLLAAKLIANVPRFEGPQSNIDVQFYREAAGDVANDSLPVGTRLAAAQRMLDIAQEYSGTGQYGPAPADGGGNQFQNTSRVVDGPRPGDVQDGYRFRGGNPADPNAWERL